MLIQWHSSHFFSLLFLYEWEKTEGGVYILKKLFISSNFMEILDYYVVGSSLLTLDIGQIPVSFSLI